ncbi:hypothetical protein [Sideroxydans sp. CL21]|nr:hypothetical protein [Sideroxydans sp. CL21]
MNAMGYAETDERMKYEGLKTGAEWTLAGNIVVGQKPAKNRQAKQL